MKEALFIFLVIGALAALTAVRYRRQISAAIRMWRMIQSARRELSAKNQPAGQSAPAAALVNCSKCSRWVPEGEAITVGSKYHFCSRTCFEKTVETR